MPETHSPEQSNTCPGDTSTNQPESETERQILINNIAALVVRQHRRRQLDESVTAVELPHEASDQA